MNFKEDKDLLNRLNEALHNIVKHCEADHFFKVVKFIDNVLIKNNYVLGDREIQELKEILYSIESYIYVDSELYENDDDYEQAKIRKLMSADWSRKIVDLRNELFGTK